MSRGFCIDGQLRLAVRVGEADRAGEIALGGLQRQRRERPEIGQHEIDGSGGRNLSSRTRSPEMRFCPSDSDRPLISRRPAVVASDALPSSASPATVPVSDTSAAGLATSALPVRRQLQPGDLAAGRLDAVAGDGERKVRRRSRALGGEREIDRADRARRQQADIGELARQRGIERLLVDCRRAGCGERARLQRYFARPRSCPRRRG